MPTIKCACCRLQYDYDQSEFGQTITCQCGTKVFLAPLPTHQRSSRTIWLLASLGTASLGLAAIVVALIATRSPRHDLTGETATPTAVDTSLTSDSAPDNDPKSVVEYVTKKGIEGDEQAVMNFLYLPDEEARTQAADFIHASLTNYLWDRALGDAFKNQYKAYHDADVQQFENALKTATVTVSGDTARVVGRDVTTVLIRDQGLWKVNFSETIRAMSPQEQKELNNPGPEVTVFTQTIADVRAARFKSSAEAQAELVKRLTAAGVRPIIIDTICRNVTSNAMRTIRDALSAFRADLKRFPTQAEGLPALTKRPTSADDRWKQPYITALPVDGWGHPFSYVTPTKSPGIPEWGIEAYSYDLNSPGPDGKLGTNDDFGNSVMGGIPADAP